ncbi:hypothetical protein K440DRAFT_664055 [Wilcoxina mikolae CBS 423.85]|nr:hypothetical protein K440DRAFT_664055 [Wilcoxina mikolae CBS 423.85]
MQHLDRTKTPAYIWDVDNYRDLSPLWLDIACQYVLMSKLRNLKSFYIETCMEYEVDISPEPDSDPYEWFDPTPGPSVETLGWRPAPRKSSEDVCLAEIEAHHWAQVLWLLRRSAGYNTGYVGCNLTSVEFIDSVIDGSYFEFLFDLFGKNLVRFKYHHLITDVDDPSFIPSTFAAALQKVRGTLEELEIRADGYNESDQIGTIGSFHDFPRLKRITTDLRSIVPRDCEGLIDTLPPGLSYLSLVPGFGDHCKGFPPYLKGNLEELVKAKVDGQFQFLEELNVINWEGQDYEVELGEGFSKLCKQVGLRCSFDREYSGPRLCASYISDLVIVYESSYL